MAPKQLVIPNMPEPEHDAGTYTERQIERGKAILREAVEWRKRNTRAWDYVVGVAKRAAMQHKRIGGRDLIEQVRRREFTSDGGTTTATDNNYAPIIARWLIREHPETAPCIECRATVFDLLMGAGR